MEKKPSFDAELQDRLQDLGSRETQVERYITSQPHTVEHLQAHHSLSRYEAGLVIYSSEVLQTSLILQELSIDDRVDSIATSFRMARDDFGILPDTYLTILEAVYLYRRKIRNLFRYNTDRGYPAEVVCTQLVIELLYPLFDSIVTLQKDIDQYWLTAIVVGAVKGTTAAKVFETLSVSNKSPLLQTGYYQTGREIVNLLDLEIDTEEAISTSLYEARIRGSRAAIWYSESSQVIVTGRSTGTDHTSLPVFVTEPLLGLDTEDRLDFIKAKVEQDQTRQGPNLFLVSCGDGHRSLNFMLVSPSVDDVNVTDIKQFLTTHLGQFPADQSQETLGEWTDYMLLKSVIPDFQVQGSMPHDERDRDWSFHSLIHYNDLELSAPVTVVGSQSKQGTATISQSKVIRLIQNLTNVVKTLKLVETSLMLILPFEVMTTVVVEPEECYYMIYSYHKETFSRMLLEDIPPSSEFHRKRSHQLNLKFIRMMVRDLSTPGEKVYVDWLLQKLGVDIPDLKIEIAELPLLPSGRVKSKSTAVAIPKGQSSVAQRLKQLEEVSDARLALQTHIFDFIQQAVQQQVVINLLDKKKIKDFISDDFRRQQLEVAHKNLDQLKDEYQVFKLSSGIGNKAIDIVKTFETLIGREVQPSLFKVSSLQQHISKLAPDQIQSILDLIELK